MTSASVNAVTSLKNKPSRGPVPLLLKILGGSEGWAQATLREAAIVGRDPSRASLVISSPGVSRAHLKLLPRGSMWVVQDLKTLNGSWLNGRRLGAKVSPLPEAGLLELGRGGVAIRFRCPTSPPVVAAPTQEAQGSRAEVTSLRQGNDRLSAALVEREARCLKLEEDIAQLRARLVGERAQELRLMKDINGAFDRLEWAVSTLLEPGEVETHLEALGLNLGLLTEALGKERGALGELLGLTLRP